MLLTPYVFRGRYLHVITGNTNPSLSARSSQFQSSKVGCPIRRSTDQRLFAPSRSLSQRTTSFFASYRQGIHQMPLSHLIALISNAHHAAATGTVPSAKKECQRPRALCPARMLCGHPKRQTHCAHCLQKDPVRSLRRAPKCTARINRPEVNQTKPELPLSAEDLCR